MYVADFVDQLLSNNLIDPEPLGPEKTLGHLEGMESGLCSILYCTHITALARHV